MWQELLPGGPERSRRQKRRPWFEYLRSREKVKEQQEKAQEQREQNEHFSEVMLYVEMNEEKLKEEFAQLSLEELLESVAELSPEELSQLQEAVQEGNVDISVDQTGEGPQAKMQMKLPDGKVSEKLVLHTTVQEKIADSALSGK